jgi:hypothetical protein
MTPEYKARRDARRAKRAAHAASKGGFVQTIDLIPVHPLAFIGLKMHPQGNGGRKNRSGHSTEHSEALVDNQEWLNSIGGIGETEGLPTAVEATISEYHDYVAMNANEIVFDPTPEDCDRILKESAL